MDQEEDQYMEDLGQLNENIVEMALVEPEKFEGAKRDSLKVPFGPKKIE